VPDVFRSEAHKSVLLLFFQAILAGVCLCVTVVFLFGSAHLGVDDKIGGTTGLAALTFLFLRASLTHYKTIQTYIMSPPVSHKIEFPAVD